MKPRRWYSSPEFQPNPQQPATTFMPTTVYWKLASRTHFGQGAVIKASLGPQPGQCSEPTEAPATRYGEPFRRTSAA